MKQSLYESLRAAENSWWYRGRTFAIISVLGKFQIKKPANVLDVGAGYGAMLPLLKRYGPVTAYEIYPEALEVCRERGYAAAFLTEGELFARTGAYSLVGAFDVLEHIEHDAAFLKRLRGVCAPEVLLIATVPAHQFLWGAHDEENRHFRRHAKQSMRSLLKESGYDVLYISYWNCALFFPAALARLLGRGGKEALMPPRPINAVLTAIVYLESLWLRFLPLPIGLSIIVVARPARA